MTRDQAKETILQRSAELLTPAKNKVSGKQSYLCPVCGNGSGKDGTGITTKPDKPTHYKCFKCGFYGDAFDIIGELHGLADFNERFKKGCEIFGLTVDAPNKSGDNTHNTYTQTAHTTPTQAQDQSGEADYSAFYTECSAKIGDTDYHTRRGLSAELCQRFYIGFCAEWKIPLETYLKGGETRSGKPRTRESWNYIPTSPRLIIPTGKGSYLARDTRADVPDAERAYSKSKVGAVQIFNLRALDKADKPIIIVEGEIDALSIMEVGGESIGLGSTSNYKKLLERLEKGSRPKHPLLLSLDNDKAGKETQDKLTAGLEALSIPFFITNVAAGFKDPNDFLCADREGFKKVVDLAENYPNEVEKKKLQRESAAASLDGFLREIEESKTKAYIPTGFKCLDSLLDGGLYAGLYVIGAISSLGKTTFCLQIADQIAKSGHDVLIFSLEMARNELIGKSVSRLTYLFDQSTDKKNAKTVRGIMTGTRYANYSHDERTLIDTALDQYKGFAGHIYITEGVGDVGIKEIRERVEKHSLITGTAPVVIIDYLQIIAPTDPHFTDKQNTDKAVLELKRMSRDLKIPILGISSFNRDNYTAPVNLASFKESGAIEYSSDVLIGLQYEGMDYQEGESEKQRDKRIRELTRENVNKAKKGASQMIEIKILKNRNGSKGSAGIAYYPMFSFFKDITEEPKETWTPISQYGQQQKAQFEELDPEDELPF